MDQISFCTALKYSEDSHSFCNDIRESIDSYFYLGGKKLKVIKIDKETNVHHVTFIKAKPALITTALKVLSYFTVVLPVLIFLLKAVLRSCVSFKIIDNPLMITTFNPTLPAVPQTLPIQQPPIHREAFLTGHDTFNERLQSIKKAGANYSDKDVYFIELANEELLKNNLTNAIEATSGIWSNTKSKDQLFERIANAYFLKGDYEEACNVIKKVWSDTKAKDAFFVKLAEVHFALNDFEEAYKVIKNVWSDTKAKDAFFVKLAEVHFALNDYEEAHRVIKDVWSDTKAKDTFFVKLANTYFGLGDYELAFKVAQGINDKIKKDECLVKIAQSYIAQNLKDKAKNVAEQISKGNPLRLIILAQVLTPEQLRAHNELESLQYRLIELIINKDYDNALALIRRYPQQAEKLSYYKNRIETEKSKEELSKLINQGNIREALTLLKNQNKDSKRDSLIVKIVKKLTKKAYLHEAASLMQLDLFKSKDNYRESLKAFAKARDVSIYTVTDSIDEIRKKIIKDLKDKNLNDLALKI